MKKGQDILVEFPGLVILHQKIPGNEVGRHQHTEHEFFLPLQGEMTVSHHQETVKAGPGRMLYVPPNLDHSFSSSSQGSGERVIWLIDQRLWRHHVQTEFMPCHFPINSLAKELIFYLLIHPKVQGFKYFVAALIESLNESLENAQIEKKSLVLSHLSGRIQDKRVQKSLEILRTQLSTASLTEVAHESGLSSRNFNRLFLKETGITPKNFLISCRIEKAKELLTQSKMTVTDISMEVGYNSLSKFISTFKKIVGSLPSDFRTSQ